MTMRANTALREPTVEAGSILDELMTAQQVAAILQLRVSTVEDYARRGVLPCIKLGRHRRFLRSQVEQAIVRLLDA
jgi:excisionase family DNA binding protein